MDILSKDWFGTAVLGAIIAALGYVLKLMIEFYQSFLEKRRLHRSQLVELRSLLRASKVAFRIQNNHARNLTKLVHSTVPNGLDAEGYEQIMSSAFKHMTEEQRELHSLIRSITENALYPTNQAILAWLKNDTYFKAQRNSLAEELSKLEAHLILWRAKYEAWIPNDKRHALVYMADEKKHGLRFPSKIDKLVDQQTGLYWVEEETETKKVE